MTIYWLNNFLFKKITNKCIIQIILNSIDINSINLSLFKIISFKKQKVLII